MQTNRGDVVKADDGLEWRVERVNGDSVVLYSLDGRTQRFVQPSQIKVNYAFLQRCCDGDLSSLMQLTDAERREFEARTWQQFFSRHIRYTDCRAARQLIEDEFHGEPISLRGLEEVAKRIDSSLPKRQL